MASIPNGVERSPKISIAWVGRTNVTDRRQTTDRQNLSSHSLKTEHISNSFTSRCHSTLRGGISSRVPSSSNEMLLYSLLADSRLCSMTARSSIVEPASNDSQMKHDGQCDMSQHYNINTRTTQGQGQWFGLVTEVTFIINHLSAAIDHEPSHLVDKVNTAETHSYCDNIKASITTSCCLPEHSSQCLKVNSVSTPATAVEATLSLLHSEP